MVYEIFDFEMTDKDTLVVRDGAKLVRIDTGNDMDSAYCIVEGRVDEDALRLSLKRKYGKSASYRGYEDVSYLLGE